MWTCLKQDNESKHMFKARRAVEMTRHKLYQHQNSLVKLTQKDVEDLQDLLKLNEENYQNILRDGSRNSNSRCKNGHYLKSQQVYSNLEKRPLDCFIPVDQGLYGCDAPSVKANINPTFVNRRS